MLDRQHRQPRCMPNEEWRVGSMSLVVVHNVPSICMALKYLLLRRQLCVLWAFMSTCVCSTSSQVKR